MLAERSVSIFNFGIFVAVQVYSSRLASPDCSGTFHWLQHVLSYKKIQREALTASCSSKMKKQRVLRFPVKWKGASDRTLR